MDQSEAKFQEQRSISSYAQGEAEVIFWLLHDNIDYRKSFYINRVGS